MPSRILSAVFIVAATLLAGGCGDKANPIAPAVQPTALTVTGRTNFDHPGETGQLTAIASFADGTTRDLTTEVAWFPAPASAWDDRGVVSVSRGALTAVGYGRAEVTAQYGSVRATVAVRVLPEGAFLLAGQVTCETLSLAGATVEVTGPSGTVSGTADRSGHYALPAQGPVSLRVSQDGYLTEVRSLAVAGDQTVDFELRMDDSSSRFAGIYRLTFSASPSCSGLPQEVSTRTYQAQVTETPQRIEVVLLGDRYPVFGETPGFFGTRNGANVTFTITSGLEDNPTFVETLPADAEGYRFLRYSGSASAALGGKPVVARFDGTVRIVHGGTGPALAECSAADHRLEFSR